MNAGSVNLVWKEASDDSLAKQRKNKGLKVEGYGLALTPLN